MTVPTVESTKYGFIINSFSKKGIPLVIEGVSGTGKSTIANLFINKIDTHTYAIVS